MTEIVEHYQIGQKYKIVIERAASTKGIDGFKVEVNGDDFDVVQNQANALYSYAKDLTKPEDSGIIEKK